MGDKTTSLGKGPGKSEWRMGRASQLGAGMQKGEVPGGR